MNVHRISRALALLTALALASCAHPSPGAGGPDPGPAGGERSTEPSGPGAPAGAKEVKVPARKGFFFSVAEGAAEASALDRAPVAAANPLPDADTQRLLQRLPAVAEQATDQKDFALRERSLPAPKTGDVIATTFPPPQRPEGPPAAAPGPLEVLRAQPEGEVPLAPNLSVTFNQPMVAVTSHDDLAKQPVPVKVTPALEGAWRWVGAKTAVFEPDTRFPMATVVDVEVPAGTQSATGGTLAAAHTFQFATPPPRVLRSSPNHGPQRPDTAMLVAFDQRIEPDAVLPTITVEAGGNARAVRLLTEAEVEADEHLARLVADLEPGRWLAFRAVEPLPTDAQVTVKVGPGTPSAEGPRKTTDPQTFSFRTYGPMKVVEHRCGWGQCYPGQPWQIRLTNPIEAKDFDVSMVTVTPEVKGLRADVSGQWLNLRGRTKGRTKYEVRLAPGLPDVFGQTLGKSDPLTFQVDAARPTLSVPGDTLLVLDPQAKARLSIFSINHRDVRVRAWKVEPSHYGAWLEFLQKRWRDEGPKEPPGRRVMDEVVKLSEAQDELIESRLDLSKALDGGSGQVIVSVEPTLSLKNLWEKRRATHYRWVQATRMGIDAVVDGDEALVWVNALGDGTPLADVEVGIEPGGPKGKTGADGLARLPLPKGSPGRQVLVARRAADVAFQPESQHLWDSGGSWVRQQPRDSLRWYTFDDRTMYRPKEEVHLKGWLRRVQGGERGDTVAVGDAARTVDWRVSDARGNEVRKGTAKVNALGGFDVKFDLPDTVNLGYATVHMTASGEGEVTGDRFSHGFQVQEFRRPEFEVGASASDGPHFVGGQGTASVSATYYAGGGLPGAEVTWQVRSQPGHFSPPNHGEFTFGRWTAWWWHGGDEDGGEFGHRSFTGRTDGAGKHTVRVDFEGVSPPRAVSVTAEASVMDVNRQAWNASTSMLVHPASHYVGLKAVRSFVQEGEPLEVDAVVADLDGQRQEGRPIAMTAARLEWVQEKGEWKQKAVETRDCAVTSGKDPVRCAFKMAQGGMVRVTATISDAEGRPNQSQMTMWIAGGKQPVSRELTEEEVRLIPSQDRFAVGETAELLVQAPFTPAEGLMTIRRGGVVRSERFTMKGATHTLKVPIEAWQVPNVHVKVDLVGEAPRTNDQGKPDPKLPSRPAFATGSLSLPVPPLSRALTVEATPLARELEPGGTTELDLVVKDAAGQPVAGAEVAVVVVDEAVLALSGKKLMDALSYFHPHRGPGARDYRLRHLVLLSNPDDVLAEVTEPEQQPMKMEEAGAMPPPASPAPAARTLMKKASAANGDADGGGASPIAVRSDFDPLAVFSPEVPTGADGRARVTVKVRDNLTRYRVMAVAVAGGQQFGQTESAITARLPLMVRPSAPRFLNFGDRFELPVVVQNQTDAPMQVDVAVKATNAELTEGAGRRVTVPAKDRVEVRFPVAAFKAGTARFQMGAASGRWADAAEVSLPVWTPATTEAFATYGDVAGAKAAVVQPVQAPGDVWTQFGGLEVTTSSTQLQALTDAFLYLVAYPYECSEQLASRVLGVAALRDVLGAFKAEGLPAPAEIVAAVGRDLERLRGLQNSDGGFGFWRRGDESWPYVSIHVAHALARAKAKGFDVPARMIQASLGYLRTIERRYPSYYSPEVRRVLTAYALYTRGLLGDPDRARARKLIAEAGGADQLPLEANGWLLTTLAGDKDSARELEALHRHLNNRVTETAGAAHFATRYSDGAHLLLHSDRRADALVLEALLHDRPQSDLVPKIVRGLLGHKTKGRWGNTQENVFVLLALDRYFHEYEKVTPNFVARVWLGDRFAGEHAFKGRTTEQHEVAVPMAYVAERPGQQPLTIGKQGAGRLYYRVGMRYAPKSLKLDPSDHGFTVERAYEAIDSPSDVRRDADGTWRIKAGAKVRVRLTMVAPTRRYHVALVDPLPAGLEPLNPALAVTGSLPPDAGPVSGGSGASAPSYWRWWGPWYQHQNLRDERAEAFSTLVWAGVHTYSYVARATTPGEFVVPPAKAEEMYAPETFGRSASDKVVVQ